MPKVRLTYWDVYLRSCDKHQDLSLHMSICVGTGTRGHCAMSYSLGWLGATTKHHLCFGLAFTGFSTAGDRIHQFIELPFTTSCQKELFIRAGLHCTDVTQGPTHINLA